MRSSWAVEAMIPKKNSLMTFPLAKLGFLLMKQLCKPLANLIKNEAKQHEFFRKYFCIPPARAYHWVDVHLIKPQKYRGRPQSWPPLTEDEEVELGANLLGEFILFSLLSTVLLMELNRQGDKKALKEKTQKDEITVLVETISDLMHQVNDLKETVHKLQKRLDSTTDDIIDFETIKSHEGGDHIQLRDFWGFSWGRRRRYENENDDFESTNPDPYSP